MLSDNRYTLIFPLPRMRYSSSYPAMRYNPVKTLSRPGNKRRTGNKNFLMCRIYILVEYTLKIRFIEKYAVFACLCIDADLITDILITFSSFMLHVFQSGIFLWT